MGYNSIAFDESLLRQAFYQNLKPIYLTNTQGNRRADIFRLVDAAIVCAPNSIAIPVSEKGRITRRLDKLAPLNGFDHTHAHDAKADVEATIFMARLIRTRNPSLWDAIMATSAKDAALGILKSQDPLALIESRYAKHNVAPVAWCGQNPSYAAEVAVFDLRHDPSDFSSLSTEQLIKVIRRPKSPIRIVRANAQPMLVPLANAVIADCPSDPLITSRMRHIQGNKDFQSRAGEALESRYAEQAASPFVERRIYDAFPSSSDMHLATTFHKAPWDSRRVILDRIADDRLRELGLRILALGAQDHLSLDEQTNFQSWLAFRRRGPAPERSFRTIAQATSECLDALEGASGGEASRLKEILCWLQSLGADTSIQRKAS
ncbi:MAG: hypothetical protein ACSLE4_10855 [Methyloceanibacter sp.]|uniref:hypothetical protein n=1 Tax=Methyloceanibacter sp. TaxID=1965321 RepID=UPI003EDF32C1